MMPSPVFYCLSTNVPFTHTKMYDVKFESDVSHPSTPPYLL